MDELDKEILNEIQWTFPLVSKPYDVIAKKIQYYTSSNQRKIN